MSLFFNCPGFKELGDLRQGNAASEVGGLGQVSRC